MTPLPGYVGHGQYAPVAPFSAISGIASALVILQICLAATSAIVLVLQIIAAGKATDFKDGVITRREFQDAIGPYLIVSLLSSLVAIAALVLVIVWSFRIASNLQKIGREPLTWKPGLTIVVWLLGGCTLNVITLFMLNEHWRGSDPSTPPRQGAWRTGPVTALVAVWFVFGLVQLVLNISSGLRSFGGVSLGNTLDAMADALADRTTFVALSGLLYIASTIVLVLIIRRLTERHVAMTRER